jgi:broad specificity phosphatase PhoE
MVEILIVKNLSSGTSPVNPDPAKKQYVSFGGNSLSEASLQKVPQLQEVVARFGPFTHAFSAINQTASETAHLLCKEVTHQARWNQIWLGSFEGVEAEKIQKAYEKVHPEAEKVPEPNDCMNSRWKSGHYAFESYEEVEKRVRDALAEMEKMGGDRQIAVITGEPFRTLMLIAQPAKEFLDSAFHKQVASFAKDEDTSKTYQEMVNRFNFKPNDGAWMRIRVEAGKVFLLEVGGAVQFRDKAPVPAYAVQKAPLPAEMPFKKSLLLTSLLLVNSTQKDMGLVAKLLSAITEYKAAEAAIEDAQGKAREARKAFKKHIEGCSFTKEFFESLKRALCTEAENNLKELERDGRITFDANAKKPDSDQIEHLTALLKAASDRVVEHPRYGEFKKARKALNPLMDQFLKSNYANIQAMQTEFNDVVRDVTDYLNGQRVKE